MTNPKIIVLGGAGMLGHKVFQRLRTEFTGVTCTIRRDVRRQPLAGVTLLQGQDVISGVDVTDFVKLDGLLGDLRPDYIVNCVGIIKQRHEAHNPIACITINALLPHQLAAAARRWGGRVIHFSTDCVFSGERGDYSEEDDSDAHDLYGRSKFLGELAEENALTLRTSIIGRELVEHRSLLDWFLSQHGRIIQGYRQVIYSGVTTNEIANVVTLILKEHPTLSGIYQVVSQPISKYDLLCSLREAYNLETEILPNDIEHSNRTMTGDRFKRATGYAPSAWPPLVRALASDPTPYDAWGITL